MGLVGEAAELLELFQWLTEQQSKEIVNSEKQMALVREEIGDVFLFLVRLADKLDVDIEKAALEKMKINAMKYPVTLSKGNIEKYNRIDKLYQLLVDSFSSNIVSSNLPGATLGILQ